jgi:hypothetical protein
MRLLPFSDGKTSRALEATLSDVWFVRLLGNTPVPLRWAIPCSYYTFIRNRLDKGEFLQFDWTQTAKSIQSDYPNSDSEENSIGSGSVASMELSPDSDPLGSYELKR